MTNTSANGLVYVDTEYYSYSQPQPEPLPFFKRLFKKELRFCYCKVCHKWVDMYDRILGIAVTDEVLYDRTDSDLVKRLLAKDWSILDTAEQVHDWALQPAVFIGLGRCDACDGPFTVLGEIHGKASNRTIYFGGIFVMEIDKNSGLILLEKSIKRDLISNNNRYTKAIEFCKVISSEQEVSRIESAHQRIADAKLFGANGMKNLRKGKLEPAETNLLNALKIFVELEDLLLSAVTYMNLGLVSIEKKHIDQAEEYFNKSLGLFEQIDYKSGIADIYELLGKLNFDNENFAQAEIFFKKYVEIGRLLSIKPAIAVGLQALGNTYLNQNKNEDAKRTYSEALELCREFEDKAGARNIQAILNKLDN